MICSIARALACVVLISALCAGPVFADPPRSPDGDGSPDASPLTDADELVALVDSIIDDISILHGLALTEVAALARQVAPIIAHVHARWFAADGDGGDGGDEAALGALDLPQRERALTLMRVLLERSAITAMFWHAPQSDTIDERALERLIDDGIHHGDDDHDPDADPAELEQTRVAREAVEIGTLMILASCPRVLSSPKCDALVLTRLQELPSNRRLSYAHVLLELPIRDDRAELTWNLIHGAYEQALDLGRDGANATVRTIGLSAIFPVPVTEVPAWFRFNLIGSLGWRADARTVGLLAYILENEYDHDLIADAAAALPAQPIDAPATRAALAAALAREHDACTLAALRLIDDNDLVAEYEAELVKRFAVADEAVADEIELVLVLQRVRSATALDAWVVRALQTIADAALLERVMDSVTAQLEARLEGWTGDATAREAGLAELLQGDTTQLVSPEGRFGHAIARDLHVLLLCSREEAPADLERAFELPADAMPMTRRALDTFATPTRLRDIPTVLATLVAVEARLHHARALDAFGARDDATVRAHAAALAALEPFMLREAAASSYALLADVERIVGDLRAREARGTRDNPDLSTPAARAQAAVARLLDARVGPREPVDARPLRAADFERLRPIGDSPLSDFAFDTTDIGTVNTIASVFDLGRLAVLALYDARRDRRLVRGFAWSASPLHRHRLPRPVTLGEAATGLLQALALDVCGATVPDTLLASDARDAFRMWFVEHYATADTEDEAAAIAVDVRLICAGARMQGLEAGAANTLAQRLSRLFALDRADTLSVALAELDGQPAATARLLIDAIERALPFADAMMAEDARDQLTWLEFETTPLAPRAALLSGDDDAFEELLDAMRTQLHAHALNAGEAARRPPSSATHAERQLAHDRALANARAVVADMLAPVATALRDRAGADADALAGKVRDVLATLTSDGPPAATWLQAPDLQALAALALGDVAAPVALAPWLTDLLRDTRDTRAGERVCDAAARAIVRLLGVTDELTDPLCARPGLDALVGALATWLQDDTLELADNPARLRDPNAPAWHASDSQRGKLAAQLAAIRTTD